MTGELLRGKDGRVSDRVSDDSTLLVSGYTDQGAPFAVITCINDISLGGISFFLDSPIKKDAIVELAICSKKIQGLIFSVRAIALRISESGSQLGCYLIAARFEGEFVQLGSNPETEDIARELEEAVKHDEQTRPLEGTAADRTSDYCQICGKRFRSTSESLRVLNQVCCFTCHLQHQSETREAEQPDFRSQIRR